MSENWEEEEVIAKVSFVVECAPSLSQANSMLGYYVPLSYISYLSDDFNVDIWYIWIACGILLSCGFRGYVLWD